MTHLASYCCASPKLMTRNYSQIMKHNKTWPKFRSVNLSVTQWYLIQSEDKFCSIKPGYCYATWRHRDRPTTPYQTSRVWRTIKRQKGTLRLLLKLLAGLFKTTGKERFPPGFLKGNLTYLCKQIHCVHSHFNARVQSIDYEVNVTLLNWEPIKGLALVTWSVICDVIRR